MSSILSVRAAGAAGVGAGYLEQPPATLGIDPERGGEIVRDRARWAAVAVLECA
jgi:hypothetical protein